MKKSTFFGITIASAIGCVLAQKVYPLIENGIRKFFRNKTLITPRGEMEMYCMETAEKLGPERLMGFIASRLDWKWGDLGYDDHGNSKYEPWSIVFKEMPEEKLQQIYVVLKSRNTINDYYLPKMYL